MPTASETTTVVTGFHKILSSADTDVQKALDTLDDHAHDDEYYTKSEVDGWVAVIKVIGYYNNSSGVPGSPALGDRWIAMFTAHGWTENHIYTYNGSSWDDRPPESGLAVYRSDSHEFHWYTGTSWENKWAHRVASGHQNELLAASDDREGQPSPAGILKDEVVTADSAGTDAHVVLFDGAGRKIKDSGKAIVTTGVANGVPALDAAGLLHYSMLPAPDELKKGGIALPQGLPAGQFLAGDGTFKTPGTGEALPLAGGTMTGRIVDLSYQAKRAIVSDTDYAVGSNFVGTIAYQTITAQRTVTLPNPTTYPGLRLRILDATTDAANHAGTYPLRIQTAAGSIMGRSEITIWQRNGEVRVESDGTNWWVDGGPAGWQMLKATPADVIQGADADIDENFVGLTGQLAPAAVDTLTAGSGWTKKFWGDTNYPSCRVADGAMYWLNIGENGPQLRGLKRSWSPPATWDVRCSVEVVERYWGVGYLATGGIIIWKSDDSSFWVGPRYDSSYPCWRVVVASFNTGGQGMTVVGGTAGLSPMTRYWLRVLYDGTKWYFLFSASGHSRTCYDWFYEMAQPWTPAGIGLGMPGHGQGTSACHFRRLWREA